MSVIPLQPLIVGVTTISASITGIMESGVTTESIFPQLDADKPIIGCVLVQQYVTPLIPFDEVKFTGEKVVLPQTF